MSRIRKPFVQFVLFVAKIINNKEIDRTHGNGYGNGHGNDYAHGGGYGNGGCPPGLRNKGCMPPGQAIA